MSNDEAIEFVVMKLVPQAQDAGCACTEDPCIACDFEN